MSQQAQLIVSKEACAEPRWFELVRQQVGSLRYGVVQVVVHGGQVTQIEKTERVRIERPRPEGA